MSKKTFAEIGNNSPVRILYCGNEESWAKYNVDLDDNITVYYNYTPDHAHVYEDKIIKESTCTTAGTRQYICKYVVKHTRK